MKIVNEFKGLILTTDVQSAAVNRRTGILYINPFKFMEIEENQQKFIIYHELGHYKLQTTSEFEADKYAVERFFWEGHKLSDSIKAMACVLSEKSPEHRARMKAIFKHALEFDKFVNHSNKKISKSQRIMNINKAKQQLEDKLEKALLAGNFKEAKSITLKLVAAAPIETKSAYALELSKIINLAEASRAEGDYYDNDYAEGDDYDDDYAEGDDYDDDYAEGDGCDLDDCAEGEYYDYAEGEDDDDAEMQYAQGFAYGLDMVENGEPNMQYAEGMEDSILFAEGVEDAILFVEGLTKEEEMPNFPNTRAGRKAKSDWLRAQKVKAKVYSKRANADAKILRQKKDKKPLGEVLGGLIEKGTALASQFKKGGGGNESTSAVMPTEEEEPSNKTMYIIIAIVVLVLAIGGFAWYKSRS